MISKFENGTIVCLTFDKSKRFIVINNAMLDGKTITVTYFNEYKGEMASAMIPELYLCHVNSLESDVS